MTDRITDNLTKARAALDKAGDELAQAIAEHLSLIHI